MLIKQVLVGGFNPFSCTEIESMLDASMQHQTKAAMASDAKHETKGECLRKLL